MNVCEKWRAETLYAHLLLNEEVQRCERVIRIIPNDDSAMRLIGALLAEKSEVWQEQKYLDMDEFNDGPH